MLPVGERGVQGEARFIAAVSGAPSVARVPHIGQFAKCAAITWRTRGAASEPPVPSGM